jgi:hypothetical protein
MYQIAELTALSETSKRIEKRTLAKLIIGYFLSLKNPEDSLECYHVKEIFQMKNDKNTSCSA